MTIPLTAPLEVTTDRPLWLPVRVNHEGGGMTAGPVSWSGPADLRVLGQAGGLVEFPEGALAYPAGKNLPVGFLDAGG